MSKKKRVNDKGVFELDDALMPMFPVDGIFKKNKTFYNLQQIMEEVFPSEFIRKYWEKIGYKPSVMDIALIIFSSGRPLYKKLLLMRSLIRFAEDGKTKECIRNYLDSEVECLRKFQQEDPGTIFEMQVSYDDGGTWYSLALMHNLNGLVGLGNLWKNAPCQENCQNNLIFPQGGNLQRNVLIRTRNPRFLIDFLYDLFRFNICQKDFSCPNSMSDNALRNKAGLAPTVDGQSYASRQGNPFHLTRYSVETLCSDENLPRFCTDVVNGQMLNVTQIRPREVDKVLACPWLCGKEFEFQHPYFGTSQFTPRATYVFVTQDYAEMPLKMDGFDVFDLCQDVSNIDKIAPLTGLEKAFLFTRFMLYGYSLLCELNAEKKDETENNEKKSKLFALFLETCTKRAPAGVEGMGDNMDTPLLTLNAAWERFTTKLGIKKRQLTSADFVDEGFNVRKYTNDELALRDRRAGYTEEEVLKRRSNANIVCDLIVKSSKEVEDAADAIVQKQQEQRRAEKLSVAAFVEFFDRTLLKTNCEKIWGLISTSN